MFSGAARKSHQSGRNLFTNLFSPKPLNPYVGLLEGLECRQMFASPVLDEILDQQVPRGRSVIVPVTADDADGDSIKYTVKSSNPDITVKVRSGPFLKLNISYSPTDTTKAFTGELVFQLFPDTAPKAVKYIMDLVEAEYYDSLTFHRIVDLNSGGSGPSAVIIQGGDPQGTGSGGPQFRFDDEYDYAGDTIFSGKGQLAMANSGNDTNGSQFFITNGPPRHLDFNHTIFGQLVRGYDILTKLADPNTVGRTPPEGGPGGNPPGGTPLVKPVITSAQIVRNRTDKVIQVSVKNGARGTITVTAEDNDGNKSVKKFDVAPIQDLNPTPAPFITPIKDKIVPIDTVSQVAIKTINPAKRSLFYEASYDQQNVLIQFDQAKGILYFLPREGFKGTLTFKVGVKTSQTDTAAVDEETFTVSVGGKAVTDPRGVRVNATAGAAATNVTVATFKSADNKAGAKDFSARILWGDGNATTGVVSKGPNGTFVVKGTNTYRAEGTFGVEVEITSDLGATARANTRAVVKDAKLEGTAEVIVGTENEALTNYILAKFKDFDPRGKASDYTVTVAWGDGAKSTIIPTSVAGQWQIAGTHTYTTAGEKDVVITIKDKGGSTETITTKALIGRSSLSINAGAASASISEGGTFSRTGASAGSFTDSQGGTHAYTGQVNWGEGGGFQNLTLTSDKKFDLTHQFKDSGTYRVTVVIRDTSNGTLATEVVTVTVTNVAPTAKATGASTAIRNVPYTINLAATDPSPADAKSKFSYQVNWGDNTATTTTATGARTATHLFPADSTTPFQVKVSALDKDSFVPGAQFTLTVTVSKFGLVTSVSEPSKTDLVVGGTSGADTFSVVRGTNGTVKVLGTGNDQLTAGVSFNGKVRIHGGDGADRITAEPSFDRDLLLFGGAGIDTLGGGAANDVLAGGNDADSLSGLNGRDLLLGEGGQDSLDGGDGEDLLVAGTSKFADDPLAYPGIMKEWTRTGAGTSYAARIERILGPDTGLNTKFTLNKKNITNDFNIDSLTGGAGTDAYFADPTNFFAKDVLVGRTSGETLVDLI